MKKLLTYTGMLLMLLFSFKAKAQPGTSWSEPFDAGTLYAGGSYSDTQYNYDYQLGAYWLAGDDIYYSFTISDYSIVSVSNCGSPLDTYLRITDSNGYDLMSNDDNGPLCGGSQASLQLNLAPGTYYVATRAVNFWMGDYVNTLITVEADTPPSPAGANFGNALDAGYFGNCMGGTFSDTQNNDPSNNFGNDLGEASDDIFYYFTVTSPSAINVSTEGSSINTYIRLYDYFTGAEIAAYGPLAPGAATVQINLPFNMYYVVVEGAGSEAGTITTSISVTPNGAPAPAGANMTAAIDAGTLAHGASFSNTFEPTDCYEIRDDLKGRIYYKFNLNTSSKVTLSANNNIYLFDAAGSQIGTASGSSFSRILFPGTYYAAAEDNLYNGWYNGQHMVHTPITTSISVMSPPAAPSGANILTAIDGGTLNSHQSYTHTLSNANSALGDDIGQSSNDIYYKFTLNGSADVAFSHCGSGLDTYMWLLKSTGGEIMHIDDNYSSPCPGLQAYMTTSLQAGTYYLVSEGYSNNSGNIKTTITAGNVNVPTIPPVSGDAVCAPFLPALSQNMNYIVSFTPRVAITDAASIRGRGACEVNTSVKYVDGLGRPIQTVQIKASPSGNDIVQPIEYDQYGREVKKYLPYSSSNNNGSYKADALIADAGVYNFFNPAGGTGTQLANGVPRIPTPLAETVLENSPLNRVQEQGAPGDAWQLANGHTVKVEYWSNAASEVLKWNITANGAQAGTYYEPNELYKTITWDENRDASQPTLKAGSTEEFKDKDGRVVLKRIWENESSSLSTYYVYDDFGNLRYVIPPAITETSFSESDTRFGQFIYAYHYDHRNRIIEKKIPGKGWEYLVYNKLDQLVASTDQNLLLNKSRWNFIKYDALGRVIAEGDFQAIIQSPAPPYFVRVNRAGMQAMVDAKPILWETRDDNSPEIENYPMDDTGGSSLKTGYTRNTVPSADQQLVHYNVINYYDNYTFQDNTFGPPAANQSQNVRALLTAVRTAGIGGWLLTVYYYDDKGRIIQTKSQNQLAGTDIVDNTYSFTGELLSSVRSHTSSGDHVIIANRYVYDHVGRKVQTFQKTGDANSTEVMLSRQSFNEIGQLTNKNLHNDMQATAFSYNPRGWLTSQTSPQFSFGLKYEDGTAPQYNGNISEQHWGAGNTLNHTFTYTYDKLNRLLSGTSPGLGEALTYDKMGNITSLTRDDFGTNTYTYNGNRLAELSGFLNRTFLYDHNGNEVRRSSISGDNFTDTHYNKWNLPLSIAVDQYWASFAYYYNGKGQKIRKYDDNPGGSTILTDYIDGIELEDGWIKVIHTDEGVARKNGSTYSYEYNLKDHLGNVRYTFYENPVSHQLERLQADDYYPFGMRKSTVAGNNKYLYNGKELQEELGQYDYGARFYDPVIGRFTTVDPLSEKRNWLTPYNYVQNNPMIRTDPTGALDDYIFDENGDFQRIDKNKKPDKLVVENSQTCKDNLIILMTLKLIQRP